MSMLPIVLHIPHSSRVIPDSCLSDILLTSSELDQELLLMTDAYTEEVAAGDWAHAIIAPFSRLVVDVERFRDDNQESMSKVGMGAVYEKTQNGHKLRNLSHHKRENMMQTYYDPHHADFFRIVTSVLAKHAHCLILDIHSFPSKPLRCESCQSSDRPEICIGSDPFHTPKHLVDTALTFFVEKGYSVSENSPFSGSIVPLEYYAQNRCVQSIMIEINRSLIMDECTGERKNSAVNIFKLFPTLVHQLLICQS